MAIDTGQIVSLYRMNTDEGATADSYGGNPLTIVGASTVSGVIKQGLLFDGVDDVVHADSLLADIATDTEGTFFGWVNLDEIKASAITNSSIFSVTKSTDNSTQLWYWVTYLSATTFRFDIFLRVDGTSQWYAQSPNLLFSSFGTNAQWSLIHNGTTPILYIDGALKTLSYVISTDKTAWVDELITNATDKATNFNLGVRIRSPLSSPVNTTMDIVGYTRQVWGVTEATEFYNGGVGNELIVVVTATSRRKIVQQRMLNV